MESILAASHGVERRRYAPRWGFVRDFEDFYAMVKYS